jgi:hypothetical protein
LVHGNASPADDVGPLSVEATDTRFKRDTEVMPAVLKEIGLKPE